MQKLKWLCLLAAACLSLTAAAADLPETLQEAVIFQINSSTAVFGGQRRTMDAPVILKDDRSAVPVKFLGEWFGGSVSWDGTSRSATLSFPGVTVQATIGSPQLLVNGASVTVEPAPFIYQDRTFLSIRTVADLLDKQLYYSGNDKPVIMTDETIPAEKLPETVTAAQKAMQPDRLFAWPVNGYYKISTIFNCDNPGCYSHNGGKNGHGALDIPAPAGTPVAAAAGGTVTFAGFGGSGNSYSGYGNIVLIDHGNGLSTHYAHLNAMNVKEGDKVEAGALVGTVGSTGFVTGNHLDFAVWKDGKKTDPFPYLAIPEQAECYESCDQPFLDAARAAQ